jgi:carboxypeptidase Taq
MTMTAQQTSAGSTAAYQALASTYTRAYRLSHLQSLAGWDQAAFMPPGGNEARGAALAELAALLHRMRTDAALAPLYERAQGEPLDAWQQANLREMLRDWQTATALPDDLVQRGTVARNRCEHAWRSLRPANDWLGFLGPFREVLSLAREEANLLAQRSGLSPYDALMDRFEPGMTTRQVREVFGELRTWLPGLIQEVQEHQRSQTVIRPVGPFDRQAQRRLCERVMRWFGFDFASGRLDVSTHPFCGGVPEDVRLTTRFSDDEFLGSLTGTIHETGHGRYEQNLPRDWVDQPLGMARSMALHESQSLSFEMQLGAHPAVVAQLAPMIVEAFGDQPAFEPANLQRLMTRVKPGLIRVDADEVTYPAHIILRFEIEQPLIDGEIEAEDIPALWDEKMKTLLDLDTRGNFRDGPLQDVHWPSGLFGYFPCYSLGAMYAAQWFAAIRRVTPDLDARLASGDLSPVFDWLRDNIWQQASRWTTDELARRASGEVLNPAHLRTHLRSRYLGAQPA